MTLARVTPPERPWGRYVAIGDSYTEGMSDPDPARPGEYVGWADRLAAMLAEAARRESADFGYANLAIRGRKMADVTERQLPLALDLKPDLVSIVGGGNDILRWNVDMNALADQLEKAVVAVRAIGADVLLATPTDPEEAPIIKHVRGRHAIHAANVWAIARRHGCHVIDQWGMRSLKDWRMWAEDRIHMNAEGHRRVAFNAFAALGYSPEDPAWETPLPKAPPLARGEWARENREWMVTHVRPWLHRRLTGRSSGDDRSAKRPELAPDDVMAPGAGRIAGADDLA